MAVQREIVDKDGNRLTVVQGGAGKAAVYGKTAAGEWVPLQVDAAGRAVLNVGEVSATIGVIEQGAAGEDPWPVQLNGSIDALRPMVGATKTASGVASEVFAEASRLEGRRGLAIKNEHPYLRIRIDGSGVTDTTGIALEPFAQAVFTLDPEVDVPVYVISEAGLAKYGVVEW